MGNYYLSRERNNAAFDPKSLREGIHAIHCQAGPEEPLEPPGTRSQAAQGWLPGRRSDLESDMETDPLLGLPQPQNLLHCLHLLGLRRLLSHVDWHGRILQKTQRA